MKNNSVKTIKGGLTVQTAIKAGGKGAMNHSRRPLRIRAAVKAGSLTANHNGRGLTVRSGVKAGGLSYNHNVRALKVRA